MAQLAEPRLRVVFMDEFERLVGATDARTPVSAGEQFRQALLTITQNGLAVCSTYRQ